ncbi:MAG TPA: T9SS type A sorting domain-containing protein, partial [bacterium]|nr:T9SS type A sorting domain-containing protein [bacterium]
SATTFTFTHPLTFVGPSSHVLRVWLRAPGDRNAFNDTLTIALRVVAGQPMALPSVESFTGQAVCPVASTLASCPSNCNLTGSAGWRNAANGLTDDIDWQAFTAATPSSGTGPDRDHTSGTGPYLYLEATQCLSKTGVLVSPCYDLTGLTQPEFSFWDHMSGGQMGRLHLDVLADGRWQLDVMPVLQGHQGTGWLPRTVSLAAYSGRTVVLRLRGTTGTGVTSDIGLDDLSVHPNPPTGIAAALTGGQVSLYPNPTAGAVRLTRPEEAKEKLTVRVLDALGRQVLTSEMTGSELSLPLDRLPEGPYFIRLTGEATSTVKAVLRVRE